MYRLLSNESPFGGDSLVEVLSHILSAAPRPLSDIVPELDAQLNAIVARCLEKDPAARYATMTELADTLNAYLLDREAGTVLTEADLVEAPVLATEKSEKIRIPGVHSRWPAAAAALVILLGAGAYEGNRRGLIRLRDASDGWLTAARLGVDAPPQAARGAELTELLQLRGVTASSRCGERGSPTLCAVPERELTQSPSATLPAVESPMSDEERARRTAAYRDYLAREGLTRLSEVTTTPDSDNTTQL
jgi:hypothetical protein